MVVYPGVKIFVVLDHKFLSPICPTKHIFYILKMQQKGCNVHFEMLNIRYSMCPIVKDQIVHINLILSNSNGLFKTVGLNFLDPG